MRGHEEALYSAEEAGLKDGAEAVSGTEEAGVPLYQSVQRTLFRGAQDEGPAAAVVSAEESSSGQAHSGENIALASQREAAAVSDVKVAAAELLAAGYEGEASPGEADSPLRELTSAKSELSSPRSSSNLRLCSTRPTAGPLKRVTPRRTRPLRRPLTRARTLQWRLGAAGSN